jgi:hypothetical protein
MKADAFEVSESHVEKLVACKGKPYAELALRLRRIASEMEDTRNPLLLWRYPFARVGWRALDWQAQVRLLRAASHYRATGEILQLKDPFGDLILHERTGARMRIRGLSNCGEYYIGEAGEAFVIEVDPPKPE